MAKKEKQTKARTILTAPPLPGEERTRVPTVDEVREELLGEVIAFVAAAVRLAIHFDAVEGARWTIACLLRAIDLLPTKGWR